MRKLLSANFSRLWKNKVFWAEMGFTALLSIFVVIANYSPEVQATENRLYLDDVFFTTYQILGFILAAGISLIIGTEYSDGTIRNKLVVGCTRAQIYFSNLITGAVSCCLVFVIHGVVTFAVGSFFFDGFQISAAQVVFSLLCAFLASLVYASAFVLIAMNCSSKSATAVVSLLLVLGLVYACSFFSASVMEPETTYGTVTITQNGVVYSDLIPNSAYIRGFQRTLYEFLYDLLPIGQLTQMYYLDFTRCSRWPVFSIGLFMATALSGFLWFRRKDIK